MCHRPGVVVGGLLACALLLSGSASAQSIGGTVTDETGGVLPGVTIEVRSPSLIEQVRTAVSDGAGEYLVVGLEAGVYSVTFQLAGFSTFVRDGVELIGQGTATVDGVLQVGSIEETVTVTGAAPVVDVQNVTQAAVMTREVLDAVPNAKTYNTLAVIVPGMTVGVTRGVTQDVGGQSGQSTMRVSIHGGDETDQRLMVNGMAVNTWTQEDSSQMWFTDGNLEEMQITHSAISAETESGGVTFNLIPRSGGNTLSTRSFVSFSHRKLQSENVDQDLLDRGLPEFMAPDGTMEPAVNRMKELWSVNPTVGGPIVRDRLWFYGSYTYQVADSFVSVLDDADPNAFVYTPSNSQTVDDQFVSDLAFRLTAQVSPNNKVQFYFDDNNVCHCHFLVGTSIPGLNIMQSAAVLSRRNVQLYQVNWTSTLSNQVLIEGGFSALPAELPFRTQENVNSDLPGIIAAGGVTRAHRGMAAWFPPGRRNWLVFDNTIVGKASLSYVTGSHAAKFGTSITRGKSDRIQDGYPHNASMITFFGNPISATFNSFPLSQTEPWEKNYIWQIGTFAQDQWTLDRLTVNAGVRWDYFRGGYPDGNIPEAPFAPAKVFPGADPVVWNDLSPRLGVVYDVRGDGRTALKATASRYVSGAGTTLVGNAVNPALLNLSDTRTWFDGGNPFGIPGLPSCIGAVDCIAGDGIAQGDPRNPFPNGELLSGTSNTAFGSMANTTRFDPEWAQGWGVRFANWEFSAGIQHEILTGLSLNVSAFRRAFVNFDATNNLLQNPGDFDEYCITVPDDSRLPGAGQQRCGYYEIRPDAFGQIENVRTSADNFGEQKNHWNGVDVTVDARMDNGFLLQGGLSTGRRTEDDCDLNANLNDPSGGGGISRVDCARQEPFLTQVKLLGSYTLPGDIAVAGTLQSIPGLPLVAEAIYTAAETTLGRPFVGAATRTLSVIDRNTEYADRVLQFDLRFTKILTVAGGRVRAMVDLYNLFNDNTVLQINQSYGAASAGGAGWLRPQALIPGRLLKFAFQADF